MPKQYIFNVRRAGKKACTYYHICSNDAAAVTWINHTATENNWGEHGLDWTVCTNSRPLSQVYKHDSDKAGYLCEIVEEIFARECSSNYPNAEFHGLSYVDLCEAAIEILECLKGADKNETLS